MRPGKALNYITAGLGMTTIGSAAPAVPRANLRDLSSRAVSDDQAIPGQINGDLTKRDKHCGGKWWYGEPVNHNCRNWLAIALTCGLIVTVMGICVCVKCGISRKDALWTRLANGGHCCVDCIAAAPQAIIKATRKRLKSGKVPPISQPYQTNSSMELPQMPPNVAPKAESRAAPGPTTHRPPERQYSWMNTLVPGPPRAKNAHR